MTDSDPGRTIPRTPPADPWHADTPPGAEADPNRTTDHVAPDTPAADGTVARTPSDVARLEEDAKARAAQGIAGYAILGELGRGGMGVVYKARHTKLNRVVALKLMLGGRGDLIRFLAEAESVAAVKHDNVVEVYDYGESDDRPFMALEYCPGGTLGELLPTKPEEAKNPRRMAALVARVARGVAAAHVLGIVHRDLKPGNVFLDADGEPKVADFGLAKRGAGGEVTQEGVGMGTPAYMAPEQAQNAKFVGPQADVWALGVMLYESLTGTRPFTGTVQEIVAKAANAEPIAPRKVVRTIPRDLELICLHCLAKQPHERYPTAKELADDLDRYSRNEPISVRPAGPLERTVKLVKRNAVVSALLGAVFMALFIGAGASLVFGLEAQEQAGVAERKQKDADDASKTAKAEAERATAETKKANRRWARAILASVRATNRFDPLSEYEKGALWELAESRRDEVAWMFLEEATRAKLQREQFANRAEYELHAMIGLDQDRRDEVSRFLLAEMRRDPSTEKATHLAQVVSRCGGLSKEIVSETVQVLVSALSKETNQNARQALAWDLAEAAIYLEPAEAAKLLASLLDAEKEFLARQAFLGGFEVIGKHLNADTAAGAATILLAVTERETVTSLARDYEHALLAVMTRMEPTQATGRLLGAMAKKTGTTGLEAVARRQVLANVLAGVVVHLDPDSAVRALVQALESESDGVGRMYLAAALAGVSSRLPPSEGGAMLAGVLAKEKNPYACLLLAKALAGTSSRLTPGIASEMCAPSATALAAAVEKEALPQSRQYFAESLAALAPHLRAAEAEKLCTSVFQALGKVMDKDPIPGNQKMLAQAQRAVAVYLDLAAVRRFAHAIPEAIRKQGNPLAQEVLALALAALAPRLDADEATRLCSEAADHLAAAVEKQSTPQARQALAKGLAAVAGPMKQAEAAKLCDRVAALLTEALVKESNSFARSQLADGLSAVAARLEPAAAARVARALVAAVGKDKDPFAAGALAMGLPVVAGRLGPADAPHIARALVGAITKETSLMPRTTYLRVLADMAAFLDPGDAVQVLVDSMNKETASLGQVRGGMSLLPVEQLSSVAAGLAPRDRPRARNAPLLAIGAFASPSNLRSSIVLFHPHFHPRPRPLPPQLLVDLLKQPLCVGQARRSVLDALEFVYQRVFTDLWEFVAYAQKHHPELDLLTPPMRPGRE